jgi:parallel beta-helix repeat protein
MRAALVLAGCFLPGIHGANAEAATYTVSTTADSGAGSLRQAINDANANPGQDIIRFQIGTGAKTISPLSALPSIVDPLIIDGSTQPGFVGTPLIEINGTSSGSNAGLRLFAGESTVRALCINRCSAQGIQIATGGTNSIVGCRIGTDPGGAISRPNGVGIWINGSTGNVIGGTTLADRNVVSGNDNAGIYILNGADNVVLGNFVGTTADGTLALPNVENGIAINNSSGNQIGGIATGSGNIVSGNGASGIYIKDPAASNNVVLGNLIGLGSDGIRIIRNDADGITIQNGPRNTIGGAETGARNVISGNAQAGVYITGTSSTNNTVSGNYIGTTAAGTAAAGNTLAGVTIGAAANLIGGPPGNVISGNKQDGILLSTSSARNTIAGNVIGLSATGTALPNLYRGINLNGSHSNIIGGPDTSARNVISGNSYDGIYLSNGSSNNLVKGNYIGTDPSGTIPRGNQKSGVAVSGAPRNFVGMAGAGNLISGNTEMGLYIMGSAATGNRVQGNKIGTDWSGTAVVSNRNEGIYISQTSSNLIGGVLPGEGNLISGNGTWGLFLTNTSWNVVQGNLIGTTTDGVSPLANSTRLTATAFHAVELSEGSRKNMVGGTDPNAGNVIAFSPAYGGIYYAGIRLRPASTNNAFLGNSIFSNSGLGIDSGAYLVTANDSCDADNGANRQQNFPVLTEVAAGTGTGVKGTLNSVRSTTYRLEFFANPSCDSLGNGEGHLYLGSGEVTTGSSCTTSFACTLPVGAPAGWVVTATATDPDNNTSEFSTCLPAGAFPTVTCSPGAGGTFNVSWPSVSTSFVLRQTQSLSPPVVWTLVTNTVTRLNGQSSVNLPAAPTRFFRLSFE